MITLLFATEPYGSNSVPAGVRECAQHAVLPADEQDAADLTTS